MDVTTDANAPWLIVGLVVLLGAAWLGAFTLPIAIVFFMFEVVLIASAVLPLI